MRLNNKIALVIGAGQSQGEGTGNGRAVALRFAQEGAAVLAVDRDGGLAAATAEIANTHGRGCLPFEADVTDERSVEKMIEFAVAQWGRIDILHYNVGISVSGRDASPEDITESAFDTIMAVNLRGAVMCVKHVLPVMRRQQDGVILTVASVSAWQRYPWVAYKASKAALIAFTQQIAIEYAADGIRANTILPGLMNTPMAVDTRARTFNRSRDDIVAERDARVPLRKKMGTAWDVANAALFLASDEAAFITGVELPVDGGALVNLPR
ncbi:SDR family NAD(P)-dependent oxidoreductase [Pigmentiphaga soli]|uniref:SDR family NAD(P)-dependent oxidoreductase n=1 Tax=Pigmentiphaga soli TaxID=1007095 RepID=A0ABP8HJB0_9BURK